MCDCIKSIIENSFDPSNVEILIKMDMCDIDTISKIHDLPHHKNLKILISDRDRCYRSIDKFLNNLIYMSNGDFVDSKITTKNFDKKFEVFDKDEPLILKGLNGENLDNGQFIQRKHKTY